MLLKFNHFLEMKNDAIMHRGGWKGQEDNLAGKGLNIKHLTVYSPSLDVTDNLWDQNTECLF